MAEFTIELTSGPGTLLGGDAGDAAEQVHVSLQAEPAALGPAVSANLAEGTVSAIFQVEAPNDALAGTLGVDLFSRALLSAGLEPRNGTFLVGPA